MSACPFCHGSMKATLLGGLEREECRTCHAVWFAGGGLARVMGESAVEALVQRARGRPGQCKHCQAALEYVPDCPACGEAAPGCPQCGTVPLAVARVAEVLVDVCTGCHGVGLDEGELAHLQRFAEADRDSWLEELHEGPPGRDGWESSCADCQRQLVPAHAFEWEARFWCGSCAPVGACPVEAKLTPREPSIEFPILPLTRYGQRNVVGEHVLLKVESALAWLFSKVLG
jgi:Zn-finger nucleic acid-binding protein